MRTKVTIKDVAIKTGVSTSTVFRVLSLQSNTFSISTSFLTTIARSINEITQGAFKKIKEDKKTRFAEGKRTLIPGYKANNKRFL
ncbi:LacI family DNA-binding transcriptional regulator [Patescibacteria group bacterium]|nr:LacI family DNA-binding transcriptional regulator [Patescibacteria group bacterium]